MNGSHASKHPCKSPRQALVLTHTHTHTHTYTGTEIEKDEHKHTKSIKMSNKNQNKLKSEALKYHEKGKPGKIEVVPTKPHATPRNKI